jgi:hypothetical protein
MAAPYVPTIRQRLRVLLSQYASAIVERADAQREVDRLYVEIQKLTEEPKGN